MLFKAERIRYQQTGKFTKIVADYLDGAGYLRPFYNLAPAPENISAQINQKQQQDVDRITLVAALKEQYKTVAASDPVQRNIESLSSANTFTICTAHQPNLFTGPLYFIYKILHAIRLADTWNRQSPGFHFVPVYYMGSEDADLEELNHTWIQGKKYVWQTGQTGAVGRMTADKDLLKLMDEMEGQLSVLPHGTEVMNLFRKCYVPGKNIQTATFELVHRLFAACGLVVLIPDNNRLKQKMIPVFEEDLFRQLPSEIVTESCARLSEHCDVQAHPREINLFFLSENIRERIIRTKDGFAVHNTSIRFTNEAMLQELRQHPERFSPNVILRGLFQETILPNLAFVGGGGELAYWLQLKDLFDHYRVPFPMLVLRNSFLAVQKKWAAMIGKLGISPSLLFSSEPEIMNSLLEQAGKKPMLNGQLHQLEALYDAMKQSATEIDLSLQQHVDALKARAVYRLQQLEKKMQRAERKKHEALRSHVQQIRQHLFPGGGLQERRENFSSFYGNFGAAFINELYQHSLALEQEFVILKEI